MRETGQEVRFLRHPRDVDVLAEHHSDDGGMCEKRRSAILIASHNIALQRTRGLVVVQLYQSDAYA